MREAKSLALAVLAALALVAGCGGTSGRPAAPAAPEAGQPQPAPPAESAAARELKANLDRFNLRIEYHGEQKGEPVHSLWLMAGVAPPYSLAPGWLVVSDLPKAQAARIVDHLEGSGLLRQGAINREKLRALPEEPYYSWQVSGKPDDQYYGELGFDAEGYKQLEALSKVLDGEAAKAMQKLLARFAEKRGTWKPLSYEHISWGEPVGGVCLGLGPDQNPLGEKGTTLKVSVWYKNVGDKPVTVPEHNAPGVNMYRLMFAAEKGGKPFYIGFVFSRNETIGPARYELQPGDRFFEEFTLAAPLTFGEVLTSPAPALPALGPGESLTLRAGICAKGDPRAEQDWTAPDTLKSGPITVSRAAAPAGAAGGAPAPSERTRKAVEAAKASLDTFDFCVHYLPREAQLNEGHGSLYLTVAQPRGEAVPGWAHLRISWEQASAILDHLAGDGFFDRAIETPKCARSFLPGPSYALSLSFEHRGGYTSYADQLGWNRHMLDGLDKLRKVLDGDPAKAMDKLLAELAPQREAAKNETAWPKEAVERVRGALPAGWSLAERGSELRVRRDEPVRMVNSINAPYGATRESLSVPVACLVSLRVGPRVSPEERQRMVRENAAIGEKLRTMETKMEHLRSKMHFTAKTDEDRKLVEDYLKVKTSAHLLPDLHAKDYSVWIAETLDWPLEYYSPEVEKECVGVRKKLRAIFTEYP